MAYKRNRILELAAYFESLGIEVNLGKNKARGNKGYFKTNGRNYRIDIAKGLTDEAVIKVLVHEFAHYVHYSYDKTLNSLRFILGEENDELTEEMIAVTVDSIPKEYAAQLFETKENLKSEIKALSRTLAQKYEDFKASVPYKSVEQKIKKTPYKYLLKYDRVKVLDGFSTKIYNLEELEGEEDIIIYLKLKSRQRSLKRINSKIARLNKYYNAPTELFARSMEAYMLSPESFALNAPRIYKCFTEVIKLNKLPLLSGLAKILLQKC